MRNQCESFSEMPFSPLADTEDYEWNEPSSTSPMIEALSPRIWGSFDCTDYPFRRRQILRTSFAPHHGIENIPSEQGYFENSHCDGSSCIRSKSNCNHEMNDEENEMNISCMVDLAPRVSGSVIRQKHSYIGVTSDTHTDKMSQGSTFGQQTQKLLSFDSSHQDHRSGDQNGDNLKFDQMYDETSQSHKSTHWRRNHRYSTSYSSQQQNIVQKCLHDALKIMQGNKVSISRNSCDNNSDISHFGGSSFYSGKDLLALATSANSCIQRSNLELKVPGGVENLQCTVNEEEPKHGRRHTKSMKSIIASTTPSTNVPSPTSYIGSIYVSGERTPHCIESSETLHRSKFFTGRDVEPNDCQQIIRRSNKSTKDDDDSTSPSLISSHTGSYIGLVNTAPLSWDNHVDYVIPIDVSSNQANDQSYELREMAHEKSMKLVCNSFDTFKEESEESDAESMQVNTTCTADETISLKESHSSITMNNSGLLEMTSICDSEDITSFQLKRSLTLTQPQRQDSLIRTSHCREDSPAPSHALSHVVSMASSSSTSEETDLFGLLRSGNFQEDALHSTADDPDDDNDNDNDDDDNDEKCNKIKTSRPIVTHFAQNCRNYASPRSKHTNTMSFQHDFLAHALLATNIFTPLSEDETFHQSIVHNTPSSAGDTLSALHIKPSSQELTNDSVGVSYSSSFTSIQSRPESVIFGPISPSSSLVTSSMVQEAYHERQSKDFGHKQYPFAQTNDVRITQSDYVNLVNRLKKLEEATRQERLDLSDPLLTNESKFFILQDRIRQLENIIDTAGRDNSSVAHGRVSGGHKTVSAVKQSKEIECKEERNQHIITLAPACTNLTVDNYHDEKCTTALKSIESKQSACALNVVRSAAVLDLDIDSDEKNEAIEEERGRWHDELSFYKKSLEKISHQMAELNIKTQLLENENKILTNELQRVKREKTWIRSARGY